jgi:hypothetical protein
MKVINNGYASWRVDSFPASAGKHYSLCFPWLGCNDREKKRLDVRSAFRHGYKRSLAPR